MEVGDLSSLSSVPYPFDTALRERRQRHMIKNRESSARLRARKQVKPLLLLPLHCSALRYPLIICLLLNYSKSCLKWISMATIFGMPLDYVVLYSLDVICHFRFSCLVVLVYGGVASAISKLGLYNTPNLKRRRICEWTMVQLDTFQIQEDQETMDKFVNFRDDGYTFKSQIPHSHIGLTEVYIRLTYNFVCFLANFCYR